MIAIAISWSPLLERARPSSRLSTTGDWLPTRPSAHRCYSLRTVRRSSISRCERTVRCLSDGDFGELYVGGARPERWRHVFASVQSLTAYGVENMPPDAFNVVVIDEFHHAEARTYRRIIDQLRPGELLGLTATPERSDGTDVRSFFDGRIAAELRLWDALGADLLCPFHYFGVADGTDLRDVRWIRGRYDEHQLEGLYTGNHARARIVLRQGSRQDQRPAPNARPWFLRQRRARRVHGGGIH